MNELQAAPVPRELGRIRRLVVKVGSAVIAARGKLRPRIIAALADDVAALRSQGLDVVMVVSGAVAAGYRTFGMDKPPTAVVERQAAASVGQHRLMARISKSFGRAGLPVAQLLMSAEDIENRRRFLSARHTLQALLAHGVIPVINENDALSDDEAKVGDNDHLAALITSVVTAELLVILSRVPGILENGSGRVIPQVEIGGDVEEHIEARLSESGVGGMAAKVAAARLAARWSVPTIIADGTTPGTLPRIVSGESVGTLFVPHDKQLSARKRWIAVRTKSRGLLRVDGGAKDAILRRGASLLPSGILDVEGDFTVGSRVDICEDGDQPFAVGLVSYSSDEIRRVKGRRASEIEGVLGYVYVEEIIHRNDMVILH